MAAKKQGPVEKLLRKAKAWLSGPEKLVSNWRNVWEDRHGKPCIHLREACRACVVGAVSVVAAEGSQEGHDARTLLLSMRPSGFSFVRRHELPEVHDLYDRAIERAHEQGL